MTLPANQFIEITYADLDAQPLACLERIYEQLGLGLRKHRA